MYDEKMVVSKTLRRLEEIGTELNITFKLIKRKKKFNTFIVKCNEHPAYEYIVAYEKKNPFYSNKLLVSDIEEDFKLHKLKNDISNFILASLN